MKKTALFGLVTALYAMPVEADVYLPAERYDVREFTSEVNDELYKRITVNDRWEGIRRTRVEQLEDLQFQDDRVHISSVYQDYISLDLSLLCKEWGKETRTICGPGPQGFDCGDVEVSKCVKEEHGYTTIKYAELKEIHRGTGAAGNDNLCFIAEGKEYEIDFKTVQGAAEAVELLQDIQYISRALTEYDGPNYAAQANFLEQQYNRAQESIARFKERDQQSRNSVHDVRCFSAHTKSDGTYDLPALEQCLNIQGERIQQPSRAAGSKK